MQSITIEVATPGNIDEMLKIERECFTAEAYTRRQILGLLQSRNALALMVKVDGEASGFIIAFIETERGHKMGHIVTIDVATRCRRKGLGSALLRKMEKMLSERGIEVVYLEVRVDNQAARKLYERQGYVKAELLEHYYPAGTHGLRLVKQLQPKQNVSS
jgi:ribosomal-protein-alanine N-acetyltransferase